MATNIEKMYEERILSVLVYIQNNLDNALSLEELAHVAHFSPFHFHRVFSAHTGESFKGYIRRLRLERAARDLIFTELSITKIAERAVFDTQQSFHRAFKNRYQKTPSAFREQKLQKTIPSSHEKKLSPVVTDINVDIKTIEPRIVAFMRNIGPYSEIKIFEIWLKLIASVGITTFLAKNTSKISIPYDSIDITSPDKIRYDACVTLDHLPNFKAKGNMGIQTLHGGLYAIITHYGSLETVESTYQLLFGVWLPTSGYEPADYPNFMLHRTIPIQTSPEALVTDIYLPLKPTMSAY